MSSVKSGQCADRPKRATKRVVRSVQYADVRNSTCHCCWRWCLKTRTHPGTLHTKQHHTVFTYAVHIVPVARSTGHHALCKLLTVHTSRSVFCTASSSIAKHILVKLPFHCKNVFLSTLCPPTCHEALQVGPNGVLIAHFCTFWKQSFCTRSRPALLPSAWIGHQEKTVGDPSSLVPLSGALPSQDEKSSTPQSYWSVAASLQNRGPSVHHGYVNCH